MFQPLDITRMAQGLAGYAGARLGVIARNIAQADTPGFKAMDLPDFAKVYASQSAGDDFSLRATKPGHVADGGAMGPFGLAQPAPSGGEASVNGNTVALEREMVKMAEVRQAHDMALSVYRVTAEITRAALGRR